MGELSVAELCVCVYVCVCMCVHAHTHAREREGGGRTKKTVCHLQLSVYNYIYHPQGLSHCNMYVVIVLHSKCKKQDCFTL